MTAELVPSITDAGLPHRTAAIVAAEQHIFATQLGAVRSGDELTTAMPEENPPPLTESELTTSLAIAEPLSLPATAWVAGRVRTASGAPVGGIMPTLQAISAAADPDDVGAAVRAAVEAAMSLALLGDPDAAAKVLAPMAHSARNPKATAAAYLAQLGDSSGWPLVERGGSDKDPITRVESARQALAFATYDDVDVRGFLLGLLGDKDDMVSDLIPDLLAAAFGSDILPALQGAKKPRNKSTRAELQRVIDSLS